MNLGRFLGLFERLQGLWWKGFVIWREWQGKSVRFDWLGLICKLILKSEGLSENPQRSLNYMLICKKSRSFFAKWWNFLEYWNYFSFGNSVELVHGPWTSQCMGRRGPSSYPFRWVLIWVVGLRSNSQGWRGANDGRPNRAEWWLGRRGHWSLAGRHYGSSTITARGGGGRWRLGGSRDAIIDDREMVRRGCDGDEGALRQRVWGEEKQHWGQKWGKQCWEVLVVPF
jgi:hypothetical protein